MSDSPFNHLPDELVAKIMCYLMNDTRSFICFSQLNKRMKRISDMLTIWPEWSTHRPTCFLISDDEDYNIKFYYDTINCNEHGSCIDRFARCGCKCEFYKGKSCETKKWSRLPPSHTSLSTDQEQQQAAFRMDHQIAHHNPVFFLQDKCYYHRLYCMLKSKFITFSSLKFEFGFLFDRGCNYATQYLFKIDKPLVEFKIRALVELELSDCYIALDWLNTILRELTNVTYLTLDQVSYEEPFLLVEDKEHVTRKLNRLRISHDRTVKINDAVFMYFLENLPAIELDLTGTKIEYKARCVKRFYPDFNSIMDGSQLTSRASELIFTFPFIHTYLRRYQSITKHLIASSTNFALEPLKRLVLDTDLKNLSITVENCMELNYPEQIKFNDSVDECDSARVRF